MPLQLRLRSDRSYLSGSALYLCNTSERKKAGEVEEYNESHAGQKGICIKILGLDGDSGDCLSGAFAGNVDDPDDFLDITEYI